jgi:hypothetical protein
MKSLLPDKIEDGRVAGNRAWGAYGKFIIQGPCGERLAILASGADEDDEQSEGWEHVSVSTRRRCPNWQEMCFVKDLFWEPEECVMQLHPPKSQWINNHPYCLHLWRSKREAIPMPPGGLVGIKGMDPKIAEVLAPLIEAIKDGCTLPISSEDRGSE